VKGSPIRYDFRGSAKAFRYSVNIAKNSDLVLSAKFNKPEKYVKYQVIPPKPIKMCEKDKNYCNRT